MKIKIEEFIHINKSDVLLNFLDTKITEMIKDSVFFLKEKYHLFQYNIAKEFLENKEKIEPWHAIDIMAIISNNKESFLEEYEKKLILILEDSFNNHEHQDLIYYKEKFLIHEENLKNIDLYLIPIIKNENNILKENISKIFNKKNPFSYYYIIIAFVLAISKFSEKNNLKFDYFIIESFKPVIKDYIIDFLPKINESIFSYFNNEDKININNINEEQKNRDISLSIISDLPKLHINKINKEEKSKDNSLSFINEEKTNNSLNIINDLQKNVINQNLNIKNTSDNKEQKKGIKTSNSYLNKIWKDYKNFPYKILNRNDFPKIKELDFLKRNEKMNFYKNFFINIINLNNELVITKKSISENEINSLKDLLLKKQDRILDSINISIKEYLQNNHSSYLLLSEDFYNEILSFKTYLININDNISNYISLKYEKYIHQEDNYFNLVIDSIIPTFPLIDDKKNNLTVYDEFNLNVLSQLIKIYSKNVSYPIFLKHNIYRLQLSILYESLKDPLFYVEKEHKIIKILNNLFNINTLFVTSYQEKLTNEITVFLEKKEVEEEDYDDLIKKIDFLDSEYKNYEEKIIENYFLTKKDDLILQNAYDHTYNFLKEYLSNSSSLLYKFILERIWGYFYTKKNISSIQENNFLFFSNPNIETKVFLNQSILFFDMLSWLFNLSYQKSKEKDNLEKINLYNQRIHENWDKICITLNIPYPITTRLKEIINKILSFYSIDDVKNSDSYFKLNSLEQLIITDLDKKVPNLLESKKRMLKTLLESKENNLDLLSYLSLNSWFELTFHEETFKVKLAFVDSHNDFYLFFNPNNKKLYKLDIYRIWYLYNKKELKKLDISFSSEEFSMLINKSIIQTTVINNYSNP